MDPTRPPSVVKLRLSCADVLEYDATRAAELRRNGVFIPSAHARSPGERVRLEIELLDGSRAYTGLAVVAGQESGGPRPGYRLFLEAPADGAVATPVPVSSRPPVISLAESLFADLPEPAAGESPPLAPRAPAQARRTPEARDIRESRRSAPCPADGARVAPRGPVAGSRSPQGPVMTLGRLARAAPASQGEEEPELVRLPPPEPEHPW